MVTAAEARAAIFTDIKCLLVYSAVQVDDAITDGLKVFVNGGIKTFGRHQDRRSLRDKRLQEDEYLATVLKSVGSKTTELRHTIQKDALGEQAFDLLNDRIDDRLSLCIVWCSCIILLHLVGKLCAHTHIKKVYR